MQALLLNKEFINRLKIALNGELPGTPSHLNMASKLRLREIKTDYDIKSAIQSSVLILLYPKQDTIFTTFILRQRYNGVHSGQVSFPGGRKEESDSSLIETALREAEEEVNIKQHEVVVLGTLSQLYIPPSNFLVLPVVAYTKTIPDFKPDPIEVADIIESGLDFLFDKNKKKETILNIRGYEIEAPYYDVNGYVVWGATAMILSELKELIERIK
ncbi:MAG: CoA pyrophosphatase [Bacteroidales bacterium]|nr:CoA pyrophosphatase [Bacteroidales bacterium]MCF8403369.1 CoA pyrophosphatase [Bacteroidales bacterium]